MVDENARKFLIGWYLVLGGFWADYESELIIQNFQMSGPIWQTKLQKLLDWDDIWYSAVFGVVDYKSELKIQKFGIAVLIWHTKMQKVTWLGWYLALGSFAFTEKYYWELLKKTTGNVQLLTTR